MPMRQLHDEWQKARSSGVRNRMNGEVLEAV